MQRNSLILLGLALASTAGLAADRAIAVPPMLQSSWAFETHVSGARLRPHLAVGFWQRSSGAKPGVGANFVSALEYQLPEAAPARVRSATFQFSGKQSQCVGAEPVVIDVYAYAADGKADVSDTSAGTRVAQLSANCSDNPAFARPIDVTAIVRQLSVPAGIRHVGFNIRKANNRQGPGIFNLAAGKLTVVLTDQALAQPPVAGMPRQPQAGRYALPSALPAAPPDAGAMATMPPLAQVPNEGPKGLLRALGTLARNAADPSVREQSNPMPGAATWQAQPQVAAAAPYTVFVENFESPATGNYTVIRAGQALRTGNHTWTVEGASVDVFNANVRREAAAFDGNQAVDLTGSPGAGVISTHFATTPGQAYVLSFHYARNNGLGATPGRAGVEVIGNSALLQQQVRHEAVRQPFNAYSRFRGTFTADGPSATLRFTSLNAGNAGIVIDAISISTAASRGNP